MQQAENREPALREELTPVPSPKKSLPKPVIVMIILVGIFFLMTIVLIVFITIRTATDMSQMSDQEYDYFINRIKSDISQ